MTMQEALPRPIPGSSRPRVSIPTLIPSAVAFRDMPPDHRLVHMHQAAADEIVREWRAARANDPRRPQQKTIDRYEQNTRMLEMKYAHEHNNEPEAMSPLDVMRHFFAHSRDLAPDSWRLYRAGFLHTFDMRAVELEKQGLPQPTMIRALAALIVTSQKPYTGDRVRATRKARTKSVRAADFDRIITHLATAYSERNQTARRAQSFAMATIATGLRPIEWVNAKLRPAEAAEVARGENPAAWLAIEVDTAKRKNDEPDWKRTILVGPGIYQIHVRQHYEGIHSFLASDPDSEDPTDNYTQRCTNALNRACKELWPRTTRGQAPIRITLYTLRHQARANVAAAYGGFVAAAMMGHSVHTGENHYSGKHRANTGAGPRQRQTGIPVPAPGQDVLAKAMEFQNNPALMEAAPSIDDLNFNAS